MNKNDNIFMVKALKLADKAASIGEVPVGAVIVMDDKIISTGYNRREIAKNSIAHAEMIAINRACKKLGGWRLNKCDMYVTLEPCPMCAGAIINARIKNIYIGAKDPKSGCFGSVCDLSEMPFNFHPMVEYGYMEKECSEKLCKFFVNLRNAKNK